MRDGLPPGPGLPELVQSVAYHRDPLGVLRRARARYGRVFTLRFPLGDPLVFAAVPERLPALLKADPGQARAGAARRSILPQASRRSPFGGDAEAHAASRARMSASFAPQRIRSLEPAIARLADEHVARWPIGRPFRLLEATRSLCTEIAVRLVLGVEDEARGEALASAVRALLAVPFNPPVPLPGGDRNGVAGRAVDGLFTWRSERLVVLLRDALGVRRAGGGAHADLLGAMVASDPPLSDEEIIDQLLIVLMAAREPPAIALANVLYELAGRPEVDRLFVAEPSSRRAIVAEVIRLRPSASAALRRLTEPMELGGHLLAAGATVACPSLLLHRDPSAFPDPDCFRAERFAGELAEGAPYLPFGGGARRCLGEALAEAEFACVLPNVLRRLRLGRVWPREERMVVRTTVNVPLRGALVRAVPRR